MVSDTGRLKPKGLHVVHTVPPYRLDFVMKADIRGLYCTCSYCMVSLDIGE